MKKLLLVVLSLFFSMAILAKPVIKFATEATYPPFESFDANGKIHGFDVDIMNALCKEMKVKCMIINQPWDSLIPGLKIGKFDALIGSMNITPAREKVVNFTNPYYNNTGSLIAATNENLVFNRQSLYGKTIGVQGGTTFETYLEGQYPNVNIKTYASTQDAFLDMQAGRINAVFGDSPIINAWLVKQQNNQYTIIGKPVDDPKYFGKGDGIAVNKNNQQLLQALNKAIVKIKTDGTYDKIKKKYFGD